MFLMKAPKGRAANLEIEIEPGFEPVDTLVDIIGLGCIIANERFVIGGRGVHHLTKHLKCRDDAKELFPQPFAILKDGFPKTEYEIEITPYGRRYDHDILRGHEHANIIMPPIHGQLSYAFEFKNTIIIRHIIQNNEQIRWRLPRFGYFSLVFDDIFNDPRIKFWINERIWNERAKKRSGFVRATEHDTRWNVAQVVHYMFQQRRFARIPFSGQENKCVGFYARHIEFADIQLHSTSQSIQWGDISGRDRNE
jgi:hypothetical protein